MDNVVSEFATSTLYDRGDFGATFLPVGEMLQIDRVLEIGEERIMCELDLLRHWVFPLHFPSDPIFPGSLLIEAAGQAIALWGWHQGLRGRPRMVRVNSKFESPVVREDQVLLIDTIVRRRQRVCVGTALVHAGLRRVAEIEQSLIIIPPPEHYRLASA